MMKLIRNISCIGLFFSFLFLQSCVTDLMDDVDDLSNSDHTQSWAFPLIHSTATISDIGEVDDIKTGPDGVIQFVMSKDSIFTIEAEKVLELEEQVPFQHTISFEDVTIPDFTTTGAASFTEMFTNVNTTAADAILALDGTISLVPAFTFSSGGLYEVDSLESYSWIHVAGGTVEIEVVNTSNIPLTNVQVDILGLEGSPLPIGTLTYASIPAGGSETESLDLSNKIISNNLSFDITNFESTGGPAGLVDLSQELEFTFNSNNISVLEGVADFDQPFYTGTFSYHLTGEDSTELASQITKIRFKQGTLFYSVTPGLTGSTKLDVSVPDSDDGTGSEFSFTEVLAPTGGSPSNGAIDLTGAEFDLTLDNSEPYNNIQFQFSSSFFEAPNTSHLRYFNLTEDFTFTLNFFGVEFEYVEGYFEDKTIVLDQSLFQWGSDLFNTMSGEVNIANPEITIITESSIGVEFGLDIDGVAKNIANDSVIMDFQEVAITNGPSIGQAGQKIKDSFSYTNSNSNVQEIIPILPNRFETYGNLQINPSGMNDLNFTYDTSSVQVHLEMVLPMEMIGGYIHVEDRQKFDRDGYEDFLDLNEQSMITSILLHFEMENAFPFEAGVSLVLIDSLDGISENVLDTILLPFLLGAAGVDENGKVNEPNFFNTTIELDEAERLAMEIANVSIIVIDLRPNADDVDSESIKVFEDDYLKTSIGIELNTIIEVDSEDE
mgnify:CR=1 FL=1